MAIKVFGPAVKAIGDAPTIALRKPPAGAAIVQAYLCVSQSMLRHPDYCMAVKWEWSATANGTPTGDGAGGGTFKTLPDGVPICRSGFDPGVLDIAIDTDFLMVAVDGAEWSGIESVSVSQTENANVADVWIRPMVTPLGGSPLGVEFAVVLEALDADGVPLNWQ